MLFKNNQFFSIQNYIREKNITTKTDCPITIIFNKIFKKIKKSLPFAEREIKESYFFALISFNNSSQAALNCVLHPC
ncbi:MAG: hypothetical protein D4R68_06600 [Ignavibacteriales bacterium]|nr:MAG: hypothetical protein D4R68_06600 [Ignavibacteriales bacterium]